LIVGPNSSGKSAVFRAIKALVLNNSSSARWIKHKMKKATVAIQMDGQPSVAWFKTKTGVTYRVEGEEYTKIGRGNVFSVCSEFPLYVDEQGSLVNMQGEWDVLFPYNRTPSQVFKLFETVNKVANSAALFQSLREDEVNHNKGIKDGIGDTARLKENIEMMEIFLNEFDEKEFNKRKEETLLGVGEEEGLLNDLATIRQCHQRQEVVSRLGEPEERQKEFSFELFDAYIILDKDLEFYRTHLTAIQGLTEQIKRAEQQLKKGRDKLSLYKSCPLCGTELEKGL